LFLSSVLTFAQIHRNLLFASTTYPRSGIGSVLLKHIIDLANAAHLPLILESTQIAKPLYAKNGFEVVKHSRIEGRGPEDVVEWPVMVREPVGGYVQGGEAGEGTVEVESLASD
jgi:predicted N-acetyltransferase YhbS